MHHDSLLLPLASDCWRYWLTCQPHPFRRSIWHHRCRQHSVSCGLSAVSSRLPETFHEPSILPTAGGTPMCLSPRCYLLVSCSHSDRLLCFLQLAAHTAGERAEDMEHTAQGMVVTVCGTSQCSLPSTHLPTAVTDHPLCCLLHRRRKRSTRCCWYVLPPRRDSQHVPLRPA